jgi:Asp-tRNA(Asn)/Glu-tRNA(Gln) amidotransferase A subunit family amidase
MAHSKGVGLKPTHGLVPYTGISSGDAINDHAGPIARSVTDIALCLDAISGRDDFDDRTLGAPMHGSTRYSSSLQPSVNGMKIGILIEGFQHQLVDENVKTTVMNAARSFTRLGATVQEVSLPLHLEGRTARPFLDSLRSSAAAMDERNFSEALSVNEKYHYQRTIAHAQLPWPVCEDYEYCATSTRLI